MSVLLCSNVHISALAAYAVRHRIGLPQLNLDYRSEATGVWSGRAVQGKRQGGHQAIWQVRNRHLARLSAARDTS